MNKRANRDYLALDFSILATMVAENPTKDEHMVRLTSPQRKAKMKK